MLSHISYQSCNVLNEDGLATALASAEVNTDVFDVGLTLSHQSAHYINHSSSVWTVLNFIVPLCGGCRLLRRLKVV